MCPSGRQGESSGHILQLYCQWLDSLIKPNLIVLKQREGFVHQWRIWTGKRDDFLLWFFLEVIAVLHMVEHPLIKLQGSGLSVFKQILYDANKFVRCMCIISRLHKCAEKKTTTRVCCKCQLHRWPFVSVSCLDLQVVWCSKPPWIKHYSNIKVAWLARWKQRAYTAGNTFNRHIFTARSEAAGEKE